MLLHAGHVDGTRIVHLTHTRLCAEGLCGETVELDGEPDLALICDECLELAVVAGVDVTVWVALPETSPAELLAA